MNYSRFWRKFRKWALVTEEEEIPYKLRTVVRIIKDNPDISLVKLAGFLDTDALYLARFLYSNSIEKVRVIKE
ncbi:hypothetical protein BFU36_06780 [Sulfolobus sp. A20]|uniref:hypothetical protein n=1 Tax=Saccharolobus sp. A20 TaxID=1891280 RepID=UPI000845F842|nr:hypothetical protein [Sulfolobus sp. A20]TRM73533.1 hypothetical protein DJ532_14815 [Sulfolobus sp. A20-N-F8]TRM84044.1 hypothetical protein DJ522_05480 [Sulfolobus sp. F3]TRM87660.1 hypothetical protein DJ529_07765 [Sulfolobus sp. C3]TRN00683.1 hypothetical protein DJ530_07090 [Sulfolobus sp. E1]TRN03434.1 hypothetical protein DJ527_02215 [Sulfolobus sp. F1]